MTRATTNRSSRVAISLCIAIAMGALPAAAQAESEDSPMRELQRQSEAVLAATSIDEVLHLLPEYEVDYITRLSPEEQAEALKHWQRSVSEQRPVAERVAGDRAAVVLESTEPQSGIGIAVIMMARIDGSWQVDGEWWLDTADSCFDIGVIELETVVVEGEYGFTVSGGFYPGAESDVQSFNRDMQGTLDVVSIEGQRFSANYEITASSDEGETVRITGTIERALMPCALR